MPTLVAKPEVVAVTVASLVRLISLLGAELVAGTHRDDIDLFEQCVRAKLFAHVDGVTPEATAAGVALAHSLIEPILRDLRERARDARASQPLPFAEEPDSSARLN